MTKFLIALAATVALVGPAHAESTQDWFGDMWNRVEAATKDDINFSCRGQVFFTGQSNRMLLSINPKKRTIAKDGRVSFYTPMPSVNNILPLGNGTLKYYPSEYGSYLYFDNNRVWLCEAI